MAEDRLAPGLLLAAPTLRDPNFRKSVVLLGRHDEEGALGWIINGRGVAPVLELFKGSGLFPDDFHYPRLPWFRREAGQGGPVAPQTGWLLYRRPPEADELPGEMDIGSDLAVTGEARAFAEFVTPEGAAANREFRLVLGCAGWAPGQLEAEIGEGSWMPAPLDVELPFAFDGDRAWDEAYRRAIGAAPAVFSGRPAKA